MKVEQSKRRKEREKNGRCRKISKRTNRKEEERGEEEEKEGKIKGQN